jgi:hypothetical protein
VFGLEDLLDVGQHLQAQGAEFGAAVVDRGQAHGPQDAVGHRRRAGDLQEVAAGGVVVEGQHVLISNFAIFCIQNSFVKFLRARGSRRTHRLRAGHGSAKPRLRRTGLGAPLGRRAAQG